MSGLLLIMNVEAEAEDTKAAVVMEMVGDGDLMTVLVAEETAAKALVGDGVATITLGGTGPYRTYSLWTG